MPGFTDSSAEEKKLVHFLETTGVDMIQWRNLNFDPDAYRRKLNISTKGREMMGIRELIGLIHKKFPHIMKGILIHHVAGYNVLERPKDANK